MSFGLVVGPANAFETPSTFNGGTGTNAGSGLAQTWTATGASSIQAPSTIGSRGFNAADYTPSIATGQPAATVYTPFASCPAATGTCTGLGTLTVTFAQPVMNPTLFVAGIGATEDQYNGDTLVAQTDSHAVLKLTTSGATLSKRSGGNLAVPDATTITAANDDTSTSCTSRNNGPVPGPTAATAACGSVQVSTQTAVTSLTFAMSAVHTKNQAVPATNLATLQEGIDAFVITASTTQDYGDAPSSYDQGDAARHVIGDLRLGASETEDNAAVNNSPTSPNAGAGAAGDTDDGVNGPITIPQTATSYSQTVALSGVSKTATLAGWIDFNQNGTFDAGERASATVNPGATSATLTWTGFTLSTASLQTYARFRVGYTASQLQSATGAADSGEVEDYPVTIQAPNVNVAKKFVGSTLDPATGGGTATYTVTVSNSSPVATTYGPLTDTPGFASSLTVTGASWTSAGPGAAPSGRASGAGPFTLAPAGTAIGGNTTHTYTVKITYTGATTTPCGGAGTALYNRAALPAGQENGSTSDNADCGPAATPSPGLTLVKSADPTTVRGAGSTVTYSFKVTNTGNVSLHDVSVADTAFSGSGTLSAIDCPTQTLAPGGDETCTATYSVTQADVDAGKVTNTAVASGTPAGSTTPVDSPPSTAVVDAPASAALTLVKSADPTTVTAAGASVAYDFTVTNTGNVSLHDVSVAETAFSGSGTLSAIDCPQASLAPGESETCTATYTVTQADVDAGKVTNTAVAHGTPAGSTTPVDSPPSTAVVNAPANPALRLVKTADPTTVSGAGQTVHYSFRVTNTGNVSVHDVSVSETAFSGSGRLSAIDCPQATLAPGAAETCTATYAVTQADVNAGTVSNTAVAHGTPPGSDTPVDSPPSTAVVNAPAVAAISLAKKVEPGTVSAAGDTVTYSFLVTDTGNVTLHDVTIDETAFSGSGSMSAISCPQTSLEPGEAETCTATYVVTQDDVDAGQVTNTAVAHGTPPGGTSPVDSPPASAVFTTSSQAGLRLTKSADPTTVSGAGQTVTYTFRVTNTGAVTVHDVGVDETAFSGSGSMSAISCPEQRLAPGDAESCTATYVVTQADVDAGKITNTAVAHGTPPQSTTPVDSPPSTAVVNAPTSASVALVKRADPTTVSAAGDTVTYSFRVTDTGNVTLSDVSVEDTTFSGSGKLSAIDCPQTSLAPGESETCTATYSATQADVDAGEITNTAVAHGTPPGSTTPVDSPPSTAVVNAPAAAALTLTKSADPATVTAAGDGVTYSFVVTNTGNVSLHDVSVAETAFSGSGTLSGIECPQTSLAPGASETCTATYSVTQADVDAGKITNTAVASGSPAGSTTPVDSPPSTAVVNVPASAALTLVKSADPTTVTAAGDAVTYSFEVTNTGNVSLRDVSVAETAFSGSGTLSAIDCPRQTLAPGESEACTATYTVTQADVDAGKVTNTAVAHGTPAGSTTPVDSPPSTAVVNAPASASISIVKKADPTTVSGAGQTVHYSFRVTNTGNVTERNVTVEDTAFSGSGKLSAIDCPQGRLAPGESETCTATYTVTQPDVDAGTVTNTAVAHGTPPGSTTPVDSAPSTAVVDAPASPAVTLVKTADPTVVRTAGSTVTYSFQVTDTGNVTVHDVSVEETAFSGSGKLSAIDCPKQSLAPGEDETCTATYAVTQDDVDAGQVTNTAVAHGTPPGSTTPLDSPPATAIVTTPADPAISLVKTADPTTVTGAGQTVRYSFRVANTGSVTVHDVGVEETAFSGSGKLSAIDCPKQSLAPGDDETCTATYTTTQGDVDAGRITNTAVAHGIPPKSDTPVDSPPSTAVVNAPTAAALTIVKKADPTTVTAVGDTVTYSFTVTDSGNVSVHDVSVEETSFSGSGKLSAIDCPKQTLAPGEDETCTATYTVTQGDVDAGKVTNTAVAHGTPPGSTTPVDSPPSTAVVNTPTDAALSLVKTADPTIVKAAGDKVAYGFRITNTGSVTLHEVGVGETAFSGSGALSAIDCPKQTLAPGEDETCTATYTVTQADVDAGKVTNTAVAHGTPPGLSTPVDSPPSTAVVTAPAAAAITVVKKADATRYVTGENVTYTFLVTNTGNVDLRGVRVAEGSFTGSGPLSAVRCPARTLAPGATMTCTAGYVVTSHDAVAGRITNTATVTGTPPGSSRPVGSAPSTVAVMADRAHQDPPPHGDPGTPSVGDPPQHPHVNTGGAAVPAGASTSRAPGVGGVLLLAGIGLVIAAVWRRRGSVRG